MLTGSHDGTVRVWDASTGEPLTPPLQCGGMVHSATFSPDGTRVLAGSGDWESTGQLHLWDLPEIRGSIEELTQLVHLLSGYTTEKTGALVPKTAVEWLNLWRALRPGHREYFSTTPAAIVAWHQTQATQCKIARQWAAASFHLTQCLKLKPDDKDLLAQLAELKANRKPQNKQW